MSKTLHYGLFAVLVAAVLCVSPPQRAQAGAIGGPLTYTGTLPPGGSTTPMTFYFRDSEPHFVLTSAGSAESISLYVTGQDGRMTRLDSCSPSSFPVQTWYRVQVVNRSRDQALCYTLVVE